jgi:hypothetical protein
MGIPVCYLVALSFVAATITYIMKFNTIFWIFISPVAVLALIASFMQYTGMAKCPMTSSGIPMCYLSLIINSAIILLVILQKRGKSNYGIEPLAQ